MSLSLPALLAALDLSQEGPDRFEGCSPAAGWRRIFGGLVVAQALVAVSRTVEGRPPHGLHALFMRPGDPDLPILYAVDRLRDGRSFSARACTASQNGQAIFTLMASFQDPEEGFDHQATMPDVPPPERLPGEAELAERFGALLPEGARRYVSQERPVEMRPVDLARYARRPGREAGPSTQAIWFRTRGAMPDDPALHRAVLAYLSDYTLLEAALSPHNRSIFEPSLQVASLDHALWFHRPVRVDEWLLYAQDTPSASGARGLARGSLFSRDGTLVASVAQEGLIRRRP